MNRSEKNNHRVIIALGGNIGDVPATFSQAMNFLGAVLSDVVMAPLYKSASLLRDNQDDYTNTACIAYTSLSPMELLDELKKTENHFGRHESGNWLARPIDLDIIDYDGEEIILPGLIIPHIAMAERPFVLLPLADIMPEYVHPVTGKTVQEMISEIGDSLDIKRC